ncbi:MAG: glycosyltransferase family 4 protein [Ignavibacteriales bacterium]|nr:glycosyltransferase family 4 protein [Ignavibacteriales bacterium]
MSLRSYIKVLLVSAFDAPFIQDDVKTIENKFILKKRIGHGLPALVKIVFNTLTTDVLFCWFASVYSFVGVFVGKMIDIKTIVVVGGVDAVKDSELGYGIWLNPWKAKLVRYVFRNATYILVVDPSLKESAISLAEYNGENIRFVPTGYDPDFWKPLGEKEKIVLTVAAVDDETTFRRKGIDTLIESAKHLPNIQFIVVGVNENISAKINLPQNFRFIPKVPRENLLPFYQKAKVYCQPSRHEGLPNALCEAMLCGCYPIATNVNGNPTALGDTGILIPVSDPEKLTAAILTGLSADSGEGIRARARIVSLFPKSKRANEIIRFIETENK